MKLLVILSTRNGTALAINLARTYPQWSFDLFSRYIFDYDQVQLRKMRNVRVLGTLDDVFVGLTECDSLITFGCSAHPSHVDALCLSLICGSLKIPRFDIQHGLFQPGTNLFGLATDLKAEAVVTDHIITWRDYGIPAHLVQKEAKGRDIIVSSNLHWAIYSDRERSIFKRSIVTLAKYFSSSKVIWRNHPAEFLYVSGQWPSRPTNSPTAFNLRYLSFDEIDTLPITATLQSAAVLVTTPSTAIIDAERMNVPVISFSTPHFDQHFANFDHPGLFRSPAECLSKVASIIAGEERGTITGLKFGLDCEKLAAKLRGADRRSEKPSIEVVLNVALDIAWKLGVKRS